MDSIRQQKISRIIQKEISIVLDQKFNHLFLGSLVTVTACETSPDLSLSKIYLSIFNAEKKEVLESISSYNKEIRFELGKKIKNKLRKVPELLFIIDDSMERASRIDELLKK